MNKTTKGALAAGAAAILLMGGTGTLAYWSDSDTVDAGDFNSGNLTLDAVSCDAGWKHVTGGADVVEVVPGDSITKLCTFTIGAAGENLSAAPTIPDTVTFERSAVTGGGTSSLDLDVAASYSLTDADSNVTALGADDEITEANDGDTLTAKIVVDFPFGTDAVNANDTQNMTVALDELTISLTQTNPVG